MCSLQVSNKRKNHYLKAICWLIITVMNNFSLPFEWARKPIFPSYKSSSFLFWSLLLHLWTWHHPAIFLDNLNSHQLYISLGTQSKEWNFLWEICHFFFALFLFCLASLRHPLKGICEKPTVNVIFMGWNIDHYFPRIMNKKIK